MGGDFPQLQMAALGGQHVRLEPLQASHLDALTAIGNDPAIWTWYTDSAATPEGMRNFVDTALRAREGGAALPFVQVDVASGQIIGSTRFGAIDRHHRRAEIGWTWLAPAYQRTPINTESKYLMLRYAFETLGLMRVEFKTDALNDKSRRALQRIGATEEGIFRRHMQTASGRVRDSVYFSVVDVEWPVVKQHIERLLAHRDTVNS